MSLSDDAVFWLQMRWYGNEPYVALDHGNLIEIDAGIGQVLLNDESAALLRLVGELPDRLIDIANQERNSYDQLYELAEEIKAAVQALKASRERGDS